MKRLTSFVPLIAFLAGCGAADSPHHLGRAGLLGYHVAAGAATQVPDGADGFVVTANGQGGYRIAWVAFAGSTSLFSAHVTCDTQFDPSSVQGLSGREQITLAADATTIDAQSVADGTADVIDLVSLTDPIYVDLRTDGAAAPVYFTGADTGRLLQSSFNPVAFTSP